MLAKVDDGGDLTSCALNPGTPPRYVPQLSQNGSDDLRWEQRTLALLASHPAFPPRGCPCPGLRPHLANHDPRRPNLDPQTPVF